MTEKERLEVVRNILNNGISMSLNDELLLKISQKLDNHIVEYLKRNSRIQDKEGDRIR